MARQSARIQCRSACQDQTLDRYFGSCSKRKSEDDLQDVQAEVTRKQHPCSAKRAAAPDSNIAVENCSIESTRLYGASGLTSPQVPLHEVDQPTWFCKLYIASSCSRTPLPNLSWGESQEVWDIMRSKEGKYRRESDFLLRHPVLQDRMRAILLDWIIEVCEVYRLHRETFHLTVDIIDRFLSVAVDIQKSQLQLIGVTALFLASKLEEIYPPKITEFAYVTDGACSVGSIEQQELIIIKALNWELNPITINAWMSVYLQMLNYSPVGNKETCFTKLLFSGHAYAQMARLMDLCVLDIGSLRFSYSVMAASILYHFSSEASVYKASGYTWNDLAQCASWMAPFAITVREEGLVHVKLYENVMMEDCHNIQTHIISLEMLEKAQERARKIQESSRASPQFETAAPATLDAILTPPPSTHKLSVSMC